MDPPSWATGLCRSGTYYEGWVSDIDEVLRVHSQETVTCFGTRRSSKASGCTAEEKKCDEIGVNKENKVSKSWSKIDLTARKGE